MNPESHRKKRAAAAARRAPKLVPVKRTVDKWEYLGIVFAAGLVAWQLVQALWMGRMGDFLFEEEDYLYFFDHPILFLIELAVVLAAAYGIFHWGRGIVGSLRK